MKKLALIPIFVFFAVSTIYSERHPYRESPHQQEGHYETRNPADNRYNTRVPHEPQLRYSDSQSYHQSHQPKEDDDSYLDTATKMLLDQGILGLAVLGMGWLVFKLFGRLETQRQESEKVLTGIVERNYDMLNKLEGRLAELSARMQNVEREVERIRS
jgi:hypothetical protein